MIGISDKTKLECIQIRAINEIEKAKILADKFQYEERGDKELYWLGRLDALVFLLAYIEEVIQV